MINAISIMIARGLAAMFIVWAFSDIIAWLGAIERISTGYQTNELYAGLIANGSLLVFGVLLWISPKAVGARLRSGIIKDEASDTADDFVAAGSFLIGLYVIALFMPDVIRSLAYLDLTDQYSSGFGVTGYMLVGQLLPLLFGVFMVAGSPLFVRLFRFIRKA